MADLQRALEIAVMAHREQREKNGKPYVFHPIRLMMAVETEQAQMAALLHDVVEDTAVTMDELVAEGFDKAVIDALRLLTHDDGSPYDAYIERIRHNAIAREVKLADLTDNMNIRRIPNLKQKDLDRLDKYHRSYLTLINHEDE